MPKDMFENSDTLMAYMQIESCMKQLREIHNALNGLKNVTKDYIEMIGGGLFVAKEKYLVEAAISVLERMVQAKKVVDAYEETDWEPVNILRQNLAEINQYFNPQWN